MIVLKKEGYSLESLRYTKEIKDFLDVVDQVKKPEPQEKIFVY